MPVGMAKMASTLELVTLLQFLNSRYRNRRLGRQNAFWSELPLDDPQRELVTLGTW